MTIGRRFLPERVNLRFPAFLDDLSEARRFDFEKFHVGRDPAAAGGRPFFRVFGAPGPAAAGHPTLKSPPGNHGKEDQTTVAAFLPWRGL